MHQLLSYYLTSTDYIEHINHCVLFIPQPSSGNCGQMMWLLGSQVLFPQTLHVKTMLIFAPEVHRIA